MGEKTKVVIDTNVIVSAFGWHGKPEEVIRLVTKGVIENFISPEMLDELRKVINYPKFNFPEVLQAEILETVFDISTIVEGKQSSDVISTDPEDNRVLECAVAGKAAFIITGDRHLLSLKRYEGIEIMTPDDFLSRRTITDESL